MHIQSIYVVTYVNMQVNNIYFTYKMDNCCWGDRSIFAQYLRRPSKSQSRQAGGTQLVRWLVFTL